MNVRNRFSALVSKARQSLGSSSKKDEADGKNPGPASSAQVRPADQPNPTPEKPGPASKLTREKSQGPNYIKISEDDPHDVGEADQIFFFNLVQKLDDDEILSKATRHYRDAFYGRTVRHSVDCRPG